MKLKYRVTPMGKCVSSLRSDTITATMSMQGKGNAVGQSAVSIVSSEHMSCSSSVTVPKFVFAQIFCKRFAHSGFKEFNVNFPQSENLLQNVKTLEILGG